MAKMAKTVVLPPGIGAYVSLFRPRPPPPGSNDPTPRYGLVLMYDKKDEAKLLAHVRAAAMEVAEAKWPGKGAAILKKQKDPIIRDGDVQYPDDATFKGKVFIRASSKAEATRKPPAVVNKIRLPDGSLERLTDDEHAYSGCTFKAEVRLFPSDKGGNPGVFVGLNSVQVVAEGERLDGRSNPDDVYESEEGEDPSNLM